MSEVLQNDASGQASGVTATQGSGGNTGGGSGNYYDTKTVSGSGTVTFDNAYPMNGSANSYKFTSGTTGTATLKWIASITDTPLTAYFQIFIALPSLPGTTTVIANFSDSSGAQIGAVAVTTTGQIRMLSASSGTISTSTKTITAGVTCRVEGYFTSSASNGASEMKLILDPTNPNSFATGSTGETNTTASGLATNGNTIARTLFGINTAQTGLENHMLYNWSDAGYIDVPGVASGWGASGVVNW